jgi:hypothetical protein
MRGAQRIPGRPAFDFIILLGALSFQAVVWTVSTLEDFSEQLELHLDSEQE